MAFETETLKKLGCGEKWRLTTSEAFFFVHETSNKVPNLQSAPAPEFVEYQGHWLIFKYRR